MAALKAVYLHQINPQNNKKITIGQKFPEFSKTAVVSIEKGKEFETITSEYLANEDNG